MGSEDKLAPGFVYFAEAAGPFAAGERVLVDPTDAWSDDRWLLVAPRKGGERFFAWAFQAGDLRMMERADGELIVFQDERHEVVGVIVGAITPPPERPSARR